MARNSVTIKHLRAFVVVANQGSFVAASDALALSRPALSQSIRQLEDQIGGALFHRTTRSVRLTRLGIGFLPVARQLVRQIDMAIAEVQGAAARNTGRVMVACLPSIACRIMPQAIAVNEASNPGLRVVVRDGNLKSIVASVVDGQADIGIGSFAMSGDALDGIVIARDRFFGIFPKSHRLANRAEVGWCDLEGSPFIAMTSENGIREQVDNAIASQGIRLTIATEVANLATVYGLLEEGIGITALPGLALPADDHPFLVYRPLTDPIVERTLRLVWRQGVGLSPAAAAIVESIKTTLSQGRILNDRRRVEWLTQPAPAAKQAIAAV